TATVALLNSGRSGSIWCDDISLRPVHINAAYFFYKDALIIMGTLVAAWLIYSFGLFKNRGWLPLVIGGCIIAGVLCANYYLEKIAGALGFDVWVLKKSGHFVLFCLLGCAAPLWLSPKTKKIEKFLPAFKHFVIIFAGLLCFAALTEFLQFTTLDRSPGIFDLSIDGAGIITGVFFAFLIKAKSAFI
ncbi:MAG: VanZ family protein, partial [Pseudomonadota bacterium]